MLSLYPHSSFEYAFGFDPGGGYTQQTTLENGRGYWGKFPAGETNTIAGGTIGSDSVSVDAGWNIIGSISTFVDTAQVEAIPPGIRSSIFFGYSSGYFGSAFLAPGQAYWVKANAPGVLLLGAPAGAARGASPLSPSTIADMHTITIADNAGMAQTLYFGSDGGEVIPLSMFTMPPLPPAGAFDCRFETPEGGSLVRTHGSQGAAEFPIAVRSTAYPLTISWNVEGTDAYELLARTAAGAARLATVQGSGRVGVTQSTQQSFTLRVVAAGGIPQEYLLDQNYPNPFNPSTSIRFGLPVGSFVTAEVFNTLGQKVRTLLSEERKAGYHVLVWDGHGDNGRDLGTGTYFFRIDARGVAGRSFSATRKLLLIK
jgi:hypothetical protein